VTGSQWCVCLPPFLATFCCVVTLWPHNLLVSHLSLSAPKLQIWWNSPKVYKIPCWQILGMHKMHWWKDKLTCKHKCLQQHSNDGDTNTDLLKMWNTAAQICTHYSKADHTPCLSSEKGSIWSICSSALCSHKDLQVTVTRHSNVMQSFIKLSWNSLLYYKTRSISLITTKTWQVAAVHNTCD